MFLTLFHRAVAACSQRRFVEGQRQPRRRRAFWQPLFLETLEDRTLPAAILDAFNFAGASGAELAQNPDTVAANVTASPITRGAGLTADNQGNIFGFGNAISSIPTGGTYGTNLSSAASLNEYYQFTVTPQSGYSLSLSGISFNAYAQNGESTFAGAVQYSLDGGNTFASVSLSGSLSGAGQRSPMQMSGSLANTAALQNNYSTVVFRVYLFGAGNNEDTGIGQTTSDNDLQVTGTVGTAQAIATGVVADNLGGGWTGGGIVGQYFDNTTFAGTPSFTRTDDRIDFASNTQPPGGSTAPGFNAVAANNFSVLWTGSLIPAFSQTYTFDGFAADTFNLEISPAGENNWTTVVNQTTYTGENFSGTWSFTAGATYNVKIQFVQYTGPWAAQLRWNSPSTPDEVINPLSDSGINTVTYDNTTYANAIQMGENQWTDPATGATVATDANGWPMADAYNIVWQGANGPEMAGTYLLQFNGLADVSINFGFATFTVDGTTYNSLPSGIGYDPTTNTTTALVNISDEATILYLNFTSSQRTETCATDTGVTNVYLMRPTSPGATTYYPIGTLFDANLEAAYSNYTVERWLTANFDTTQVTWSQRILPTYAEASYSDTDEVWEYEVELANETGKDLYITIPVNANTQYVTDLAELIKYGSDGVNPYTSYQADPVYPGLNLNLHVYFEWSNETWNYSFSQSDAATADAQQAVSDYLSGNTSAADYTDGEILDYNGQGSSADFRLWTALMTVQASDVFRSVWGNAAMGDQVLPLLEYQYDNDQDSALTELQFIDDYFDNGAGIEYVTNPQPVSYYIWGSGAAVYYSSPNPTGTQTAITIPDDSFETPAVPANTDAVDPSGSSWTFTGNAGIYNGGGSMGSLGDVQIAPDGSQAAFIGDTGSISTTIDFTQTGTFAIQVDAANKFGDENALRLYIDGQEITPDYQNDPNYANPFDYAWSPGEYTFGLIDTNYNSLGTAPFTISTTGDYTLTIVGTGAVGTYTFLDDLQVTSLAAIFAAGVPGDGQTGGEPAQVMASYQAELNAQAAYAVTFGLHLVAYEGGWSLGGDSGGTPLENYAKYVSSQTVTANITSYDDFLQSGGALYIYGTYEQWPSANTVAANSSSLLQAVDATNNVLPSTPTNGLPVPANLTSADLTLSYNNTGSTLSTTGWLSWNLLIPTYGTYSISATTGSGGNALILLDDAATIASGASGGTLSGTVTLTAGLHTILIEATSGSFSVTQATIANPDTPSAPTLDSVVPGSSEATVTWSDVSGATGYLVRYGTSTGDYTASVTVGDVATLTIPGLINDETWYFAVDAFDANGVGIPSNEISAFTLSPGEVATLATYSFAGYVGDETSAAATLVAPSLSVSTLTRGSGLLNDGDTEISANTFASCANGNVFAQYLDASIADNQYYQFTITPTPGDSLSLQTLDFSPWFQNATGESGDPRSAGVTYSTNGVTFSSGLFGSGTPSTSPSPFTVDLSGQASLQNTTCTITFRIYLYGSAAYETCGLGSIGVIGCYATPAVVATAAAITSLSTLTASTITPVIFTATVTAGSGGGPNNGEVEFFNGTALLATAITNSSCGSATTFAVSTDVLAGIYSTIQAVYIPGSSGYTASTSNVYGSTLTISNVMSSAFTVASASATPSGFVLTFTAPISANSTVLYSSPGDTLLGPADVTVVGATTGPVRGSLVIDPTDPYMATFVQTAGLLAAGAYTVTVTSAVTSVSGTPLAGTYSTTLTVPTTTGPVLSLPSFARGPGQSVVLTDSLGNATGIPLSISNATDVTQASFTITYDPTLLTIAGSEALTLSSTATAAQLTNLTYTISSVDAHHNVLTVNLSGGVGLTTTTATALLTILASVPTTAPYLDKEVLNLNSVMINSANAPGVSSVSVVAYLGDVLGTGLPNATDASLVDQVASGSGTGFNAFKDLDPVIIAGVGGGLLLNANDASLIDEAASGATISQIPSIPIAVSLTFGGPDPYLYLSAVEGSPGQTVTETLYLDVTDPNGIQLTALDEAIAFDAGALQISDVRGTTALAALGSYDTASTVDNGSGTFVVAQAFMGTGLPPVVPYGTDIPVLQFNVTLNAAVAVGSETSLILLQNGTVNNVTQYTAVSDNEGALTWTPGKAPSNSGNTAVDGSVTVVATTAPVVPVATVPVPFPLPLVEHAVVKPVVRMLQANTTPLMVSMLAKILPTPLPSPAVYSPTSPIVEGSIPPVIPRVATVALDEVYRQMPTHSPSGRLSRAEATGSTATTEQQVALWLEEVAFVDPDTKRKSNLP